jgi:membrane protein DedA with SNARE-associated domain
LTTVDAATAPPRPPSRRVLTLILVPLSAMVIASNTAFFVWSSIVDRHPLLLITLSSQNRYLALTTNALDAWSYYLVASARLLAPDPLFYLLGFWYGAKAIDWMERRLPSLGTSLRVLEKGFAKASYVIVFVAPNNPVCLLAGAAAMRPLIFAILNVSGTFARLMLIRALGNFFDKPINSVLGFVKDYRWYIFALSGVMLAFSLWSDSRKGGSELDALRHLEDDLEGEAGSEGTGEAAEPSGDGAGGERTD